jgi:Kdo2-lipid IVA lauroyltransferase/acyltransferase
MRVFQIDFTLLSKIIMRFLYYLVLIPFSKLPSWFLYRISDLMYLVLYHVLGYRKKVVNTNIKNSFPHLTSKEVTAIERVFYVHFCDLIVESIKAFTISKEELERRFTQRNPELFQKYFDNNQHVTMVGGHYGNWELYAVSIAQHVAHQPVALFTKLTNKFMNDKITSSRSKFGLWMKNYEQVKTLMEIKSQQPMAIIFGTDQCPKMSQQPYWVKFLNQETGVQFGAEKFARENNTPVIYGVIHRIKRGHYEVAYELVCEKPNELPIGKITEIHTKLLERDIVNEPAFWLWTHKRWKRTKADFDNVIVKSV